MAQRTRARRPKPELESLDDRALPSAFGSGFFGALAAERAALAAQRQEMMVQRQEMIAQRREMIAQRQSLLAAERASFFAAPMTLARPAGFLTRAMPFAGQTPVFVGNMPVNPFPTPSGFFSFVNTPDGPAGFRAAVAPTMTNTASTTVANPTIVPNPTVVASPAPTTTAITTNGAPFAGQTPVFVGNMPVNPFPTPSGYYSYINTPDGPAGFR